MKVSELDYEDVLPGTHVVSDATGVWGVVSGKQCTHWDRHGNPDPDKMFVFIDWDSGSKSVQPINLLDRVTIRNT
jgi:hypothetical protein